MTVPSSALRGIRSCIIRAIWDVVRYLIAAQAKAGGYQFHQVVLTTLYGNLRAARNDRATAYNLRRRHGYAMNDPGLTRDSCPLEEAAVSNMGGLRDEELVHLFCLVRGMRETRQSRARLVRPPCSGAEQCRCTISSSLCRLNPSKKSHHAICEYPDHQGA